MNIYRCRPESDHGGWAEIPMRGHVTALGDHHTGVGL